MNQRGRNRRIDATRQTEQHLVLADFRADAGDRFVDVSGHAPIALETADFAHETLDDRFALQRMRDFRMELHRVETACFIRHACDWARSIARDDFESAWHCRDFIAMTHPHIEQAVAFAIGPVLDILE